MRKRIAYIVLGLALMLTLIPIIVVFFYLPRADTIEPREIRRIDYTFDKDDENASVNLDKDDETASVNQNYQRHYVFDESTFEFSSANDLARYAREKQTDNGLIFISMVSYRDRKCGETLKSIFQTCTQCSKIRIGLVDQYDEKYDDPCHAPIEYREKVRVFRMPAHMAKGPAFARYLASTLWDGEQYYMQIDAQIMFVTSWDSKMRRMASMIPATKYVLSHNPVESLAQVFEPKIPYPCTGRFDDRFQGIFTVKSQWIRKRSDTEQPLLSPFIASGFLFAPSILLADAPFSRHLPFLLNGEELLLAARVWTSGYDFYVPHETVCFYSNRTNENDDMKAAAGSVTDSDSARRVLYHLGYRDNLPANTAELKVLGLGTTRSLAQFFAFTGLNITSRSILDHCNDEFNVKTGLFERNTNFKRLFNFSTIPYYNELTSEFLPRARRLLGNLKKGHIFVSISSYRDDICDKTLTELFAKCKHCSRISVGVVEQNKPDSDDKPCNGSAEFRRQVSKVAMSSEDAKGPTSARYIASKLWDGEEYYMQLDSHIHIVQDWDEVLVKMYLSLPTKKGLFSVYPPVDTFDLSTPSYSVPWICNGTMDDPSAVFVQTADSWLDNEDRRLQALHAIPGVAPFLGAGFIFAPSLILLDAPYDRYLDYLFHGEELLMAVRLWTRNWDIFVPTRNVVTHVYGYRKASVYSDHALAYDKMSEAKQRVKYLLGLQNELPIRADELDILGIGKERTLQEFWEFSGFDLPNHKRTANRCVHVYDYLNKKWIPRDDPDM